MKKRETKREIRWETTKRNKRQKKKKTKRETTKRKKNDEPIIDFHAVFSLTVGIRTTITISFFLGIPGKIISYKNLRK